LKKIEICEACEKALFWLIFYALGLNLMGLARC